MGRRPYSGVARLQSELLLTVYSALWVTSQIRRAPATTTRLTPCLVQTGLSQRGRRCLQNVRQEWQPQRTVASGEAFVRRQSHCGPKRSLLQTGPELVSCAPAFARGSLRSACPCRAGYADAAAPSVSNKPEALGVTALGRRGAPAVSRSQLPRPCLPEAARACPPGQPCLPHPPPPPILCRARAFST